MANLAEKSNHEMRLHDLQGARLYLTQAERERFLVAVQSMNRMDRTFCMTICLTGCRISEALNLTYGDIDLEDQTVIFESLKKRKKGIYRAVPVPSGLIEALDLVHGIKEASRGGKANQAHLGHFAEKPLIPVL